MGDLANLTIWDDPAIRGALSWYLDVAENRRPAKFRIAATVPTQLDPPASSEDALWVELDRLTPILLHELQGPAESLRIELLLSFENEGFRVTHVYNRRRSFRRTARDEPILMRLPFATVAERRAA